MVTRSIIVAAGAVALCGCASALPSTSSQAPHAPVAASTTTSTGVASPGRSRPPTPACPALAEAAPQATPAASTALPPTQILASIRTDSAPSQLLDADGSVWVSAHRGSVVDRIDPRTNAIVATVRVGSDAYVGPISSGPDGLWMPTYDGNVVRIDPATNSIATSIAVPHADSVLDTPEGLWVATSDPDNPALVDVDPATGRTIRSVPVGPGGHDLAFGFGSLWVASEANATGRTDESQASLLRIDPASGTVAAQVALRAVPGNLAVGADGLYVALNDLSVARVDPASGCVAAVAFLGRTIDRQPAPWSEAITMFVGGDALDVGYDRGALAVLDPVTLAVRSASRVDTQSYQGAVMQAFGSIWFSGFSNNVLYRLRSQP